MYYKLTIKKIDRETKEEFVIYQGNRNTHNECEQIRNRICSHVNRTRYYTSTKIERR